MGTELLAYAAAIALAGALAGVLIGFVIRGARARRQAEKFTAEVKQLKEKLENASKSVPAEAVVSSKRWTGNEVAAAVGAIAALLLRMRTVRTKEITLTFIAALVLASCSASQQPKHTFPTLEGVRVAFSHRGASPNLWDLHLGETGAKKYSTQPGNDYWLRLFNNSPFTISFPTQSMYLAKPLELVPIKPDSKAFAIADGSEVAVLFVSSESRYGAGDMFSESFLPAGRSILFNVPRRYLKRKHSIYIEYSVYPPVA